MGRGEGQSGESELLCTIHLNLNRDPGEGKASAHIGADGLGR